MPIDSSSSTQPSSAAPSVVQDAGARANSLGSEAFLKLLVTQLQNQDPTAPQSNTEFIAQLATFSSLEQLTAINKAVSAMASFLGQVNQLSTMTDDQSA